MDKITESSERKQRTTKIGREIFALAVWSYLVVKLLVFDFDVYLSQRYMPNFEWFIKFKFLVILAALAVLWWCLGSKKMFTLLGFVIIYPALLIVWRLPMLLLQAKSWVLTFIVSGCAISFIKSIKLNLSMLALLSFCCVLVLVNDSVYVVLCAIIGLLVFLITHFVRRFYFSLTPFKVFLFEPSLFTKILKSLRDTWRAPEAMRAGNIQKASESDIQKWSINLQMAIIGNRLCYFLASKLRSFQRSNVTVALYCSSIVYTLFIVIIVFTFVNYGLYKIQPDSYHTPQDAGFWSFFYYSFNTLFTNSVADFYATSNWARFFSILEISFGFLTIVILFFLVTGVLIERRREEIDNAIVIIRAQGEELDSFIREEYNLTVDDAVREIEKIKGSMIKLISYLASNID